MSFYSILIKKLLLILFLLPLFSIAQQYTEVIEIPNKSGEQLYRSSKEWFALAFKTSDNVIQLDDSAEKKIIGKGNKQVEWSENLKVHFTLIVQFKDGRYKYDIQATDIEIFNGAHYTYESLKLSGTEEGLKSEYEKMGIKSSRVNKSVFQERLELYQSAVMKVENSLHEIVDDHTLYLEKANETNNW